MKRYIYALFLLLVGILFVLKFYGPVFGGKIASEKALQNGTVSHIPTATEVSTAALNKSRQNPSNHRIISEKSTTLSSEFNTSDDLDQFVIDHIGDAKNGNAEAARLISKAYADCAPFGANPRQYSEGIKSTLSQTLSPHDMAIFSQALEREETRCRSLGTEPLNGHEASDWMHTAAMNGDLAARVIGSLSQRPTTTAFNSAVDEIATTKNAEAMYTLGDVLANMPSQTRSDMGSISGSPVSSDAWKLAACSFGLDCTSNGYVLLDICLRSGLCEFGSLQEFYANVLSPIQYQQVLALSNEIVRSISSGNFSALGSTSSPNPD